MNSSFCQLEKYLLSLYVYVRGLARDVDQQFLLPPYVYARGLARDVDQQFLWSPYVYAGAGKDPTLLLIFDFNYHSNFNRLINFMIIFCTILLFIMNLLKRRTETSNKKFSKKIKRK